VLTTPDAELKTTRHIESVCKVPPGAGVLQMLVAVAVFVDCRNVVDGVEVTS
jgi:hypothetical protein